MTKQELYDLIDAEINTNGQRRITGAKLNAILKTIVDNMPIFDPVFNNRIVKIGEDGHLEQTPKLTISDKVYSTGIMVNGDIEGRDVVLDGNITASGNITIDGEIDASDIKVNNDALIHGSIDVGGNATVAGNVAANNNVTTDTDLEAKGHGLYLYEMGDRYLVSIDHGAIRVDQG